MIPAVDERLVRVPAPGFDLDVTLGCGQVFHWQRVGKGYAGAVGDIPIYVEQQDGELIVTRGCEELATRYFALDHPLDEIQKSFPVDSAMQAALGACPGLRIIRQPLWECLASFITSALKQVGHIAQISHSLRRRYGQRIGRAVELEIFAYPDAARLAASTEADLRACGLGFRARSLLETALALTEHRREHEADRLEQLRACGRPEALHALCQFRGVGTKVANCVLLFGYEHLDAFPVDVWIERVLRENYFADQPETSSARLQEFANAYFGRYGGYAQQYLFHHSRMTGRRKLPAESPDSRTIVPRPKKAIPVRAQSR